MVEHFSPQYELHFLHFTRNITPVIVIKGGVRLKDGNMFSCVNFFVISDCIILYYMLCIFNNYIRTYNKPYAGALDKHTKYSNNMQYPYKTRQGYVPKSSLVSYRLSKSIHSCQILCSK